MDELEAERFAAWRGMRLLTPGEWLFCALGAERRLFPWVAYERQDSVANTLDLGLGRPCPVGTFEGGRTPGEVYDLDVDLTNNYADGDSRRFMTRAIEPQFGDPVGPRGEILRRHGDQMLRLHRGFFRAHGRADDTMNLGGIKVSSVELEAANGVVALAIVNAALASVDRRGQAVKLAEVIDRARARVADEDQSAA